MPAEHHAPFKEICKALDLLKESLVLRKMGAFVPFQDKNSICSGLKKELFKLAKHSIVTVRIDNKLVISQWAKYKSKDPGFKITKKWFRKFCWIPEILCDEEFISILDSNKFSLSILALRGLIYSYHEKFKTLSRNPDLNKILIDQLASHASGRYELIKRWHENSDHILGSAAVEKLTDASLEHLAPPEAILADWGLTATTQFDRLFAGELAITVSRRFASIKVDRIAYLLEKIVSSDLVDKSEQKEALSNIILSGAAADREEVQKEILEFVLKNKSLLDPRVYPENWTGLPASAKNRVIQWISKEDINLFFELLLKDGKDRHNRRRFWLQYVSKVKRSRALISAEDRKMHAAKLREWEEKGRSFGSLVGSNPASAFVLDFGKIVVVEFSEVGNACYFYSSKDFLSIIENFWRNEILFNDLKNKKLAGERINHNPKSWQYDAKNILADWGIRGD
jgi:hypothetical protein